MFKNTYNGPILTLHLHTSSYLYLPHLAPRWDRSVRCKRTDQSAAVVVCLMSPPANEKRAFTYIRLQRTDRSQRGHYAKRALTPRSLNVKVGPQRKGHKGRAVWLA